LVAPALQQQQSVQDADRFTRMRHVLGLCGMVLVGAPVVSVSVV